jgi:hypothetical protein
VVGNKPFDTVDLNREADAVRVTLHDVLAVLHARLDKIIQVGVVEDLIFQHPLDALQVDRGVHLLFLGVADPVEQGQVRAVGGHAVLQHALADAFAVVKDQSFDVAVFAG